MVKTMLIDPRAQVMSEMKVWSGRKEQAIIVSACAWIYWRQREKYQSFATVVPLPSNNKRKK